MIKKHPFLFSIILVLFSCNNNYINSQNKNISNLVFCDTEDRLEYVEKSIKKYDFLKSKHFIHLNQLDYVDQIQQFNELLKTLPYENDGFIFISKKNL